MSALNAGTDAPSRYLQTKGEAETRVHAAAGLKVTSFQPAAMFGPGDGLFNRFAGLLKLAPIFPLACPGASFAPVYVGDVAEAFARTLKDPDCFGKRLQLCGPRTLTLQQIVEYTAACLGRKRLIIPLPDALSRAQAALIDLGGFLFHITGTEKPFSRDNYLSLRLDSVCPGGGDLQQLGITPTPIEAVVPQYLGHLTQKDRYAGFRQGSRGRT
jgi:NADH dehydrogenase